MFIHNNQICFIWKLNANSFTQAIKELKPNFKVLDNVVSDKFVKGFNRYKNKPQKVQSPLTSIFVYDLENFNKDRAVLYASCLITLARFQLNTIEIKQKRASKTFK